MVNKMGPLALVTPCAEKQARGLKATEVIAYVTCISLNFPLSISVMIVTTIAPPTLVFVISDAVQENVVVSPVFHVISSVPGACPTTVRQL